MAGITSLEQFIEGGSGTFTIIGTTEVVKNFYAIKVESDTVFARIELNGVTATDERDEYLDTIGGTVPAGTLLVAGTNASGVSNVFSAVTLTSGVVTGLKTPYGQ